MIRLLPTCTALLLLVAPACTPAEVDGPDVPGGGGEGEGEGEDEPALPTPTATATISPGYGVPADGTSSVVVEVTLAGEAIAGRVVQLSTAAGPDEVGSVVSDDNGAVRFELVSSVDGQFAIELAVDGVLVALDDGTGTAPAVRFNRCTSLKTTYATDLYPLVFTRCIGCHNEFGYAPMMGAELVLAFPGDEDFAIRGVEAVRAMMQKSSADGLDVDVATLSDEQRAQLSLEPGQTHISRVLANPMFGSDVGHLGGVVFSPNDREEITRFQAFLARLEGDDTCAVGSEHGIVDEDLLASTSMLSPKESFKRAQLSLTGLNASTTTLNAVVDEASLATAIDTLLTNRRVEDRLAEIWNDWLLTDKNAGDNPNYLGAAFSRRTFFNPLQSEGARGINSCNDSNPANCCRVAEDPRNLDDNDDNDVAPKPQNVACEQKRLELRVMAGKEPIEFLRRLWREQRPAETMLQADFTVVNPATAKVYGLLAADNRTFLDGETQSFNNNAADDATELRVTRVIASANNQIATRSPDASAWPHQGLLSMPSFLSRYPTTVSNRERTRARAVYELFLGVPVMKLAAFATPEIPPGQSLENLTWDTQPCIVCHALLDPVAATFNSFTGNGGAIVASRPCRTDGMRSPGFGFINLPGEGFIPRAALDDDDDCTAPFDGEGEGVSDNKGDERLAWLADRVVEHPRFAYAVIVPLYEGLVGSKVLSPPDALVDPDFGAKSRAYVAQQRELQSLVSVYRAGGGRLQPVVRSILLSRSFRADVVVSDGFDAVDTAERDRALELMNLGHKAKLLTPELLARRLTLTTGLPWAHLRSPNRADALEAVAGPYSIFWGGIDSENVTQRSRDPVAIRAAVARRMGHEVACVVVPQEFSMVTKTDRKLLRVIEPTDVPVAADGTVDDVVLARVRDQIRRLHVTLWNEPEIDDAEVDASLELFLAALQAMRAPADGVPVSPSLGSCAAMSLFVPGTRPPYPPTGTVVIDEVEHRRVSTDADYTIRAWMAVLSSVLADARFIME
ncbi:MAG TPA: hypothetical protein VGF99_13000 [Myxococcota bacterium]